MDRFETLDDFLDKSWRLLLNASVKRNHPMRTPVLGTFDGERAQLRTVILRQTDIPKRTLLFYSDFRAAKIAHLQKNMQLAGLFYHPRKQWQIRVRGDITLHHEDDVAQSHWSKQSIVSRANYASELVPGTVTDECTDGLPHGWNSNMDIADTEFAFANFAVIALEVAEMDTLLLHRAGHQRAHFTWKNGSWQKNWLVP